MMDGILIYAFAAAVLGGLESPAGAVVGGLAIGVALNLLTGYVSCDHARAAAARRVPDHARRPPRQALRPLRPGGAEESMKLAVRLGIVAAAAAAIAFLPLGH